MPAPVPEVVPAPEPQPLDGGPVRPGPQTPAPPRTSQARSWIFFPATTPPAELNGPKSVRQAVADRELLLR